METMNQYKSKADNAVTTGNAVLQDAEQTLKTLQGISSSSVIKHQKNAYNGKSLNFRKEKMNAFSFFRL